ncbi:hypothetical protein HJC23_007021 [Cyclotella cryptica]|uniref:CS domain-containing protein n=1 Tax=Cyclotella cryptica TaxID=29204 RepID=A0ABD3QPA0_9STRA|eukprot:CCRYP_004374-RA/>CCRYP_004374-RA protein AED:0.31 eAED:0.31 QI:0/-1/0/1/-1/1/1/0/579
MPLTPRYNLTQTPTHVHIEVSIPHVRVSPSTLELVVDNNELHLYAPPTYLLKLVLPERVVEESLVDAQSSGLESTDDARKTLVQVIDDSEEGNAIEKSMSPTANWTEEDLPKMQYDPCKNHGTIIIILRKEVDGIWDDLDLLGRLQRPVQNDVGPRSKEPLISVCGEDGENVGDQVSEHDATPSTIGIMNDLTTVNHESLRYGLFQNFSNVFRDYAREGLAHDMLECPNPDEPFSFTGQDTAASVEGLRREMRLDTENDKFDNDRYLADVDIALEGDMIYDMAMGIIPHWMDVTIQRSSQNGDCEGDVDFSSKPFFTAEESHLLATLPQKSNLLPNLTTEQKRSNFLCLSDILFAYSYDHRTTDGDPTVESSWTVMILSPTLSWLEHYNPPYDDIVDVMRWCIRRALIYPYLRSYSLALQLAHDVGQIFIRGRRTVIRCLLQVHQIMEKSESHYLFNKLYIDPLIWLVQNCDEDDFAMFGEEILCLLRSESDEINNGDDHTADHSGLLGKVFLGLGLVELEQSLYNDQNSSTSDEDDEASSDSSLSAEDTNGLSNKNNKGEGKLVELMQSLDVESGTSV